VKSGERVSLSADGSTGAQLAIENADTVNAWFIAPAVTSSETIHIILAVPDRGTPPLTRYQRVIVTVSL
jgi:hypothetical protein